MRLYQYVFLLLSFLLNFNLKAADPQVFIMENGNSAATVMILQEDGSLLGWGQDRSGILMRPRYSSSSASMSSDNNINIPVSLDIDDVETMFLTGLSAYALKQDGSLWYWGYHVPAEYTGSLGSSLFPLEDRTKPYIPQLAEIPEQGEIKKLVYIANHMILLTERNELYLAYSSYGTSRFYPESASNSSTAPTANRLALLATQVSDFSATDRHILILKTDGRVWSVGFNESGQLGTDNTTNYNTPQSVINISNVAQVYAARYSRLVGGNAYSSSSYSLAVKNDGTVWGWGASQNLGIGLADGSNQLTPVQIDIEDVKTLRASRHTLALKNDGTVWAWGDNTYGQLGFGSETQSSEEFGEFVTEPTQVQIEDVAAIGVGIDFSVALKNDGEILTWGNNRNGMLGNGIDNVEQHLPESINQYTLYMPEGFIGDEIEEFIALLNTHEETVNATCTIYYDDGVNFSFPLELLPERRTSFSLKEKGVQFYRPFAIVIEPEKRITATFIHYAEGNVALGANFTPITSKKWSTAQGFFDHAGRVRNYLVGFNPHEETVSIDLRMTGFTDAFPRDINMTVGAKRRFSIKLQDHLTDQIPEQPIGALVSADKDIVIGMSHYDDNLNEASLTIAEPSWGNLAGIVGEGWLSDTGFEVINIMNPNAQKARISFYNNGGGFADWYLEPYQQTALVVSDFLPKNQPLSLSFRSVGYNDYDNDGQYIPELPMVTSFNHFDLSGLNGVNFTTKPHTHWEIAEGFKSPDVLEFLLIARGNTSTSQEINITVKLYYQDGQANAELDLVIPRYASKAALLLHEDDRLRGGNALAYSITVDADAPVVPYFTHYDFNFGGAFALSGTGWNP